MSLGDQGGQYYDGDSLAGEGETEDEEDEEEEEAEDEVLLSFLEFLAAFKKQLQPPKTEEETKKIFNLFDQEGKGNLTAETLQAVPRGPQGDHRNRHQASESNTNRITKTGDHVVFCCILPRLRGSALL